MSMQQSVPIILASASPRRREILAMLGIEFSVEASSADETVALTEPGEIVTELAMRKAGAVFRNHKEDCLVIGSDTIVWKDNMILGKPADTAEAEAMLRSLSGDVNTVYTGVCILYRKNGTVVRETFFEDADVRFAPMTEEEITWYASTGEPMDKAGAYAVQGLGGRFIRGIQGDFYTVVGLPLCRLYETLRKIGALTAEETAKEPAEETVILEE